MKLCANVLLGTLLLSSAAHAAQVTFLDDGEKVARETRHALPPSAWPDGKPIELTALRGETVAFQAMVTAEGDAAAGEDDLRAVMAPLMSTSHPGVRLDADVQMYGERFVPILAPSREAKGSASLAFTEEAAPTADAFFGSFADPLVPGDTSAKPGERAAIWIDVTVPLDAAADIYTGTVIVASRLGALATRALSLRVLPAVLPYAAAKTMVYYEPKTLEARMGSRDAGRELRFLLHVHHLSAIRDVTAASDGALDEEALSGHLYTGAEGYRGPGEGIGEGVFAIGAYGSLGAPTEAAVRTASALRAFALLAANGADGSTNALDVFLYAADEQCDSPLPKAWQAALAAASSPLVVAASCGNDPATQAAEIVMQTPEDLSPSAPHAGKEVWAYNGRRPFAGAMVLDVPATDLRANAWIAARYDLPRWFYWESTFWRDGNRGGKGGANGFDPFTTAETFHDADGDASNGDGVLLYPGTQKIAGMTDLRRDDLLPSIRLKNLRRGIEDAGYIALAKAVDPQATLAIVRRMIPRALKDAPPDAPPSWPERGLPWLHAREELAAIVAREPIPTHPEDAVLPANDQTDKDTRSPRLVWAIAITLAAGALVALTLRRRATPRER